MEQSLSFSQQQKLKMNTQLAQAIHILQLSTLDLQDLVAQEYLENPLLEIDEKNLLTSGDDFQPTKELMDYYSKDDEKPPAYANDEIILPLGQNKELSLEEYVLEQLRYSPSDSKIKALAQYLAGLLDEAGYLPATLPEDLPAALINYFSPALELIQSLEPLGIGARNLRECLQIQAKGKNLYQGLLKTIIDHHLEDLSKSRLSELAKKLNVTPQAIQNTQDLIKAKFQPKPGIAYGNLNQQYIIPDIYAQVRGDKLDITFNEQTNPQLKINPLYRQANLDKDCQQYLKERLNSALGLIKAIEQRRLTLIKVVEAIAQYQRDVFFQGLVALKPLQMKDIAQKLDIHESTVSRAIANKYMAMPYGTIPLKEFFQGANLSSSGEEIATKKIKARISILIQEENKAKPLSDEKLSKILQEEGFTISRRTVMKYREQLNFPSSAKRKRY